MTTEDNTATILNFNEDVDTKSTMEVDDSMFVIIPDLPNFSFNMADQLVYSSNTRRPVKSRIHKDGVRRFHININTGASNNYYVPLEYILRHLIMKESLLDLINLQANRLKGTLGVMPKLWSDSSP